MSTPLEQARFQVACHKELLAMIELNMVAPRYAAVASILIDEHDWSRMSVRDAVDHALSLARVVEDYRVKAKVNYDPSWSTRR